MLMLRVDDTYIDLYENQPVNLKYQYSDLGQIQAAVGNFSQSFRIPATDNNRAVFGQFQDPNEVGGFNPKQKVDAWLFVDTVPIMTGVVQLKKATVRNGKHTEFEIVFFGESVALGKELGNKKLKDLDLSSYDHTVDWNNVEDSWAGNLLSGDVRYGLIDKAYNWNQNGGNVINSNNPLYAGSFTPFLRVPVIVQEIMTQNGFTLVGDFSDTTYNNYYTPFYNGTQSILSDDGSEGAVLNVGVDAENEFVAANGENIFEFTDWSDTSPFVDPDNLFDTSTGYFSPPFTGYIQLQFLVDIDSDPGNTDFSYVQLQFYRSDDLLLWSSGVQEIVGGETASFNETPVLVFDQSDDYYLAVRIFSNSGNVFTTSYVNFGILFPSGLLFGQTIGMSNNAPDITQIDYLTSIGKMFNCVFIPDKLDPSKITIDTWGNYHSGGTVKDWTEKLDISKDLVIEPSTDLQKKKYEFTYSEGEDFTNKFYQDTANRVYGRYLIEEQGNDFATGELKIKPSFAPYPCSFIGGTSILIHKSVTEDGSIIKEPKCKVVYWGGLQACENLVVFDDDGFTNVTITQYPYFGHYSVPNPDVGDIDLNYGGEIPPHPIQSSPSDNLYNTYWRDYVNELYSDEARILTAHFKLNEVDVSGFEWSDNIWIKDSYWRILEMDYSPNSDTVTKVKLIKILASIRACEWIPYQGNADGTITFIDSEGTQGTPTATCCEAFGYVFQNGACYANGFGGNIVPLPEGNSIGLSRSLNRGNVYANGSNITTVAGAEGFASGLEIAISQVGALAIGRMIDVTAPFATALGENINAFVQGQHYGGGWMTEFDFTKGQAQAGRVIFSYEGDFGSTDEVELLINGVDRLSIPNNTALSCRMDVMITTEGVSGGVSNVEYLTFYEILEKSTAGVASAFYSSHTNNPVIQIGDFGGGNKFHLDIDTATDTSQHRLTLHNQSTSNTENTRIVCVMNYLMATL